MYSKLNVSRIGHTSVFNTSDGDGGFFDNLVNDIQDDLNSLVNDVTSDIAEALDLPDFFNVHLMGFCEGSYMPNATVHHARENITDCSNRTTLFHFEPTKVIQEKLPSGITLDDIHWPQTIEDAERALKIASIAMVVLYIIGITFAGIAILTALWGIWAGGRLSAIVNFLIDMVRAKTTKRASSQWTQTDSSFAARLPCPWNCIGHCYGNHREGCRQHQQIWRRYWNRSI